MFYLKVPLGATSHGERVATFGFMVRPNPDRPGADGIPFRRMPVANIEFNAKGERSLRLFGVETSRLSANGSAASAAGAASDVNWWVIGGVTIGAAVVIANEERKSKQSSAPPSTPKKVSGGQ